MTRTNKKPNLLLLLGLTLLLCGEAWFGYHVHALSSRQKEIREDYNTVNNITFGIFSVDQWRDKVLAVINKQVKDYQMTDEQKQALRAEVEQQLHNLVSKEVAEINKPQKSIGGKLKKAAFNSLVNVDDIQKQVPSFAAAIIRKVNSPASTTRLKDIVKTKLNQLRKQTFDSTATAAKAVDSIVFRKYQVTNLKDLDHHLKIQLDTTRQRTYNDAYAMLACVLTALALWWLMRKEAHMQSTLFLMSLLFALVLLIVGVTASIIEVEAKVQSLSFLLMGEKVGFDNQVLFFQSKSIIGIVVSLLNQSKPDAIVVGALILLFVILLPIIRMFARGIHIFRPKNKVAEYLALQSSKWDMADVMVVGILMTYIGLNGIVKSQLSNLNVHSSLLTATTANNTSLQPGFFIFTGYALFTILLSHLLKKLKVHK